MRFRVSMARTFSGASRLGPEAGRGVWIKVGVSLTRIGLAADAVRAAAGAGHDHGSRTARPSGRAAGRTLPGPEPGPFSSAPEAADRTHLAPRGLLAVRPPRYSGVLARGSSPQRRGRARRRVRPDRPRRRVARRCRGHAPHRERTLRQPPGRMPPRSECARRPGRGHGAFGHRCLRDRSRREEGAGPGPVGRVELRCGHGRRHGPGREPRCRSRGRAARSPCSLVRMARR